MTRTLLAARVAAWGVPAGAPPPAAAQEAGHAAQADAQRRPARFEESQRGSK